MNFNGFAASSILNSDLNANGHSIDNLDTFTQLETPAVPPAPGPADSAKYFTDNTGTLSSIDNHGVVRQYASSTGGIQDRINSSDLSSEVHCLNGGVVAVTGATDFQNNPINNPASINTLQPFFINGNNVVIAADIDQIYMHHGGNLRFLVDPVNSALLSPNMQTFLAMIDTEIAMGVNGVSTVFVADATKTQIIQSANNISLLNTETTMTLPIHIHSANLVGSPEYSFDDSNSTGIYSSATGHVSVAAAGSQAADFTAAGIATPGVLVNGNYSLPTTAPTPGQVINSTNGIPAWTSLFNGFQAQYTTGTLSVNVGANTQSVCDTLVLGSNYNTGTFMFTAPITGIYELGYTVQVQWTSVISPATFRFDCAFQIVDGPTTFPGYTFQRTFIPLATNQTYNNNNTTSIYRTLNAGATVQISVANNSTSNPLTIINAALHGRLLQQTA